MRVLLCLVLFLCSSVSSAVEISKFRYHDHIAIEPAQGLVTLTQEARDRIAGDGLLSILQQAASKPVLDNGTEEMLGFAIFDIEPYSVFEYAGIKNGDLVTHIADVAIREPTIAISMLRYVRGLDEFSYTVRHCVANCRKFYSQHDQIYGAPKRYTVHVTK